MPARSGWRWSPGFAWGVRLLAPESFLPCRLLGDESGLDAPASVEQSPHGQAQHGAPGFENLAPRDLGLAQLPVREDDRHLTDAENLPARSSTAFR